MTSHLLESEIDGRPIPDEVVKNCTGMVYFGAPSPPYLPRCRSH